MREDSRHILGSLGSSGIKMMGGKWPAEQIINIENKTTFRICIQYLSKAVKVLVCKNEWSDNGGLVTN